MQAIKTLDEFASDSVIIRLLAMERGKYAVKNSETRECDDSLYNELKEMMPPRKIWRNPGKKRRPEKSSSNGLASWTHDKKLATSRVLMTILKYREKTPEADWVKKLNAFLSEMHSILRGERDFVLTAPKIIAKEKKADKSTGEVVYRPICVYTDLRTKLILAITYRYIINFFDRCFGDHILFMRSPMLCRTSHRH